MEIGLLEQKEIARYFKLNERIMENKVRIKQLRETLYDKSLMSHVANNEGHLFRLREIKGGVKCFLYLSHLEK